MITEKTEHYTLPYSLGGLLYTPALNDGIAEKIISRRFPCLRSLALCLEDAICDSAVSEAEKTLVSTLKSLYAHISEKGREGLPLLFIRVRSPEHLMNIHNMLGELEDILCGYILPKFDCSNGQSYAENIMDINSSLRENEKRIYAMPIFESRGVADSTGRISALNSIKKITDSIKEYVLNIRVGGNDLCSLYGLRRSADQTIYDIGVVRDILNDIINVFSFEYVVSGAVWEYFGKTGEPGQWSHGLERELRLDMLNGFVGKTAVHPSQLPVIDKALRVTRTDLEDAVKIINWSSDELGVEKSFGGSRMNEVKCHRRWAQKIKILGEIYGIKNENDI